VEKSMKYFQNKSLFPVLIGKNKILFEKNRI
jgi:hypothetical protein